MASIVAAALRPLVALALGRKSVKAPRKVGPGRPRKGVKKYGGKFAKSRKNPVHNDGAGNQRVSFRHGRRPKRMPKRKEAQIRETLTPVDTASFVETGTSTTAYGQCEYTCENSETGNIDDIDAIIANAKNNNDSEVKPGLTGKFFINSYDTELKIINATNSVTNLRVYEIICRRDVPTSMGDLANLTAVGFSKQAPSVGTFITKNWLGGSLYQCVGLTPYYKIVRDKRMTLAPGKELRLTLSHKMPRVMNPVVVDSTNILALGNYTRAFIVQHWGQPIGDTPANPLNQVISTSVSKILWTVTRKYKYQEQYDNAGNTFELSPAIPLLFPTPTVLVNQLNGELRPEVRA